jgi:hypothetical protein
MEAATLIEIYPTLVKKSGCALAVETLELVQIKIKALDLVFFGKFPKIIFSRVLNRLHYFFDGFIQYRLKKSSDFLLGGDKF